MSKKQIAKEIVIWILTLLLVAMFLNAGIRKFPESGGWTKFFRYAGYPVWFRIFIGVAEVGAALLLLWPRTASYGAAAVVILMIGAIATVIAKFPLRGTAPGIACLIVGSIVLVARWPRRLVPQQ
jgi:uncharacterized membrane protein YphA (DoxX/SURF4 family)